MDGRGEESLVWRIFLIDKLRFGFIGWRFNRELNLAIAIATVLASYCK